MPSDPLQELTEVELDALWTVYEGHSLIIEYPEADGEDPYAHAVMSVDFENGEAVAEVAEIMLDTALHLVELGYLVLSEDGPVLDETEWFDEELGSNVKAEEYVLSPKGQAVIDATADPVEDADDDEWDDEDDDYDEDDDDDDDDEDEDDDEDWDDDWDDEFDDDDDEDEDDD